MDKTINKFKRKFYWTYMHMVKSKQYIYIKCNPIVVAWDLYTSKPIGYVSGSATIWRVLILCRLTSPRDTISVTYLFFVNVFGFVIYLGSFVKLLWPNYHNKLSQAHLHLWQFQNVVKFFTTKWLLELNSASIVFNSTHVYSCLLMKWLLHFIQNIYI